MGKKLEKINNFRVVVYPRRLGDLGYISMPDPPNPEREYSDRCEEIIEQIKRHVDNISFAEMKCDKEYVCEFCGYRWTESLNSVHNGGCCDEDIEIMEGADKCQTT